MISFTEYFIFCESSAPVQQFRLNDQNFAGMYKIFKKSYEDSTGAAWSRDVFRNKAGQWTFFGVPPTSEDDASAGFVSVRFQRSGLVKLTGVAGNPFSIASGLKLLNQGGYPIWGGVSGRIANMATKKGFKIIPSNVLIALKNQGIAIPGMEIDNTGGLTANIAEIGAVDKVAIANDKYINWIITMNPNLADEFVDIIPAL